MMGIFFLVGHRSNFCLEHLNSMKAMLDTLLSGTHTNKYNVENAIAEGFQLSNQRIKINQEAWLSYINNDTVFHIYRYIEIYNYVFRNFLID
ncbi:unnamed protein product [Acanthoscelides obtectus]|nr:unnamed protein product [Acanthoscelides obtectus]CAK1629105.1 hypothetical protein AOBTE_LOCUS5582 [Acanthoscelides obtectus]